MSESHHGTDNNNGNTVNNRWVIGKVLGDGSVGVVHDCNDKRNQYHSLAIKISRHSACAEENDDAEDAFCNEIKVLETLGARDPMLRIPKMYEHGVHNTTSYIVMQKFGKSVEEYWVEANQHFSNTTILMLTLQVFDIVASLHHSDFYHGDIKISNIVSQSSDLESIYLIDFGNSGSLMPFRRLYDVFDVLDMAVELFRDGCGALIPLEQLSEFSFGHRSPEQEETIRNNVEMAYNFRARTDNPIPEEFRLTVEEALKNDFPNYERMRETLVSALEMSGSHIFEWNRSYK